MIEPQQTNGRTNLAGRVASWLAVAALVMGGWPADAPADDATFREFPDGEVASPPELFRSLIELSVDLPRPLANPDLPGTGQGPVRSPGPPSHQLPEQPTDPLKIPDLTGNGRNRIDEPPPTAPSRAEILQRIREAYLRTQSNSGSARIPNAGQPMPTVASGPSDDGSPPADPNANPNDGFRDRMNRIFLRAAEDSLARKANADASKLNVLERTFRRLADSAKERLDKKNPNWRKRLGRKLGNLDDRIIRSGRDSVALLQGGTSSAGDSAGPLRMTPWLLAMAALLLVGLAVFVWRRLSPQLARRPPSLLMRLQITLKPIDSRGDLILAVDRFLIWSLGARSESWNCQIVKTILSAAYPGLHLEIVQLLDDYEVARYAPQSFEVSTSQLKRSSATLRQLVAAESAESARKNPLQPA